MRNKLQLNIPEPCHENWENMLPSEKGKFCQSCRKQVVDFTTMTDAQLITFFKKPAPGSVCGRFMDDQLSRDIQSPRKTLPWVKYFFQVAIPAFLISVKADAQDRSVKGKMVTVSSAKTIKKNDSRKIIEQPFFQGKIIRGVVIDKDGTPIPYSSVIIKATSQGVMTDSTGSFLLQTDYSDTLLTLVVSSISFSAIEKTMNVIDYIPGSVMLIQLEHETVSLSGVVLNSNCGRHALGGAVSSAFITRSFKDSVVDFFRPVAKFSVYPNPAINGQSISIENKKLADDNYSIELINLSGQTVFSQLKSISRRQRISINVPPVSPGSYIIKLTGKQSRKIFAEKIIIVSD